MSNFQRQGFGVNLKSGVAALKNGVTDGENLTRNLSFSVIFHFVCMKVLFIFYLNECISNSHIGSKLTL